MVCVGSCMEQMTTFGYSVNVVNDFIFLALKSTKNLFQMCLYDCPSIFCAVP